LTLELLDLSVLLYLSLLGISLETALYILSRGS